MSLSDWIADLLRRISCSPRACDVVDHVNRVDQQSREIRHDLKNIHARGAALQRLVMRMRNDDTWRQEQQRDQHP